ncbi:MAG: T9SS type A sorting domain-containing protein [Rhodothermia bacterium]|nr:T9SS type A sorting domain-containing protein [Rhodothermia bacterium]
MEKYLMKKTFFFLMLLFALTINRTQAQTPHIEVAPCLEYWVFANPSDPNQWGEVCMNPYLGDPANGSATQEQREYYKKTKPNHCFIGRIFSYEKLVRWREYWMILNKGKLNCYSNYFIDNGVRYEVPPIMSKGKDWLDDIAIPIDIDHIKAKLIDGELVLSGFPESISVLEFSKNKAIITSPKSAVIIKKGQYLLHNGEVTLGKLISLQSPTHQYGKIQDNLLDAGYKIDFKEGVYRLFGPGGEVETDLPIVELVMEFENRYGIVTPVGDEILNLVEIIVDEILWGIVNPTGEELCGIVTPVGEEVVSIVEIVVDEILLGIVSPIDVDLEIVNPSGEIDVNIIDITIDDVLIGIVPPVGDEIANAIINPIEDIPIDRIGDATNPTSATEVLTTSAYPNPFNPSTQLSFTLPHAATVRLSVFDLQGKEVAKLVNGTFKEAGSHQVQFDAGNLPSGVYFYRIVAGNFVATKRIQLLK